MRWFAFWDHSIRWDSRWHAEQLVHQYAFWLEGKNPWTLCQSGDAEPSDQLYSLRVAAWNVPLMQTAR